MTRMWLCIVGIGVSKKIYTDESPTRSVIEVYHEADFLKCVEPGTLLYWDNMGLKVEEEIALSRDTELLPQKKHVTNRELC
jgi:hypothetical protein